MAIYEWKVQTTSVEPNATGLPTTQQVLNDLEEDDWEIFATHSEVINNGWYIVIISRKG